ncbi:MAG: PAS domain-containing sensor histidine kinase [Gammaproteobacteria bacterium]
MTGRRRRRLKFQHRVFLFVLAAAAPAWLATALLLAAWEASVLLRATILVAVTFFVVVGAAAVQRHVVSPFRALANMLEALREEDYSLRGRNVDPDDALGEVMIEVNLLGRMLQSRRFGELEAGVLLRKVITEIDIAVFAFDVERRLRLINRAGEALLGKEAADLLGRTATDLGLAELLVGPSGRIVTHAFPGGVGRWEVRRRRFREGGRPHQLLVISDVSRALREEERQAWRRIVRVIGHELNSSLAPIKSMAATLRTLIAKDPLPEDWRDDTRVGLTIIHDRADALSRFMGAYARLAKLPPPTRRTVDFGSLVRRAASLQGDRVEVEPGPDVAISIDADQVEQVLINVMKNAVEAAGDDGAVRVRWRESDGVLVTEIEDDGPGIARTENLWVPFFTTKPSGTGIGLVLSREIVENHGGTITLDNRDGARGCIARIVLPLG